MSGLDELFAGERVLAILRGMPVAQTVRLANLAWDNGIGLVEVPLGGEDSLAALAATVAAGRDRGRPVGAGTVLTAEQVAAAADAGCAFTVAPGLDRDVSVACAGRGLPHLPGVATPSEVQAALRLGHRWLKVFPAGALGPGWFSAVRGPFPGVHLVATGGIDAGNAPAYLAAGARAVGVGSALADPAQLTALARL